MSHSSPRDIDNLVNIHPFSVARKWTHGMYAVLIAVVQTSLMLQPHQHTEAFVLELPQLTSPLWFVLVVWYCVRVCLDMKTTLNIDVFRIPYSPKEEEKKSD
eukprot:m.102485 g.102485  ORF g.102485 m.102485 type:complete len:102 (-) comp13223_c2_seq3:1648-1953(-)